MKNGLEENKTPELLLAKQSYIIAGREFMMHHDYSWDESEWLEEFLKRIKNSGNVFKSENISKEDATKFLRTVLRYKDSSAPEDFNFGSATKTETAKIITDFFLTYALLKISMDEFLKLSANEKEQLLMNLMI